MISALIEQSSALLKAVTNHCFSLDQIP